MRHFCCLIAIGLGLALPLLGQTRPAAPVAAALPNSPKLLAIQINGSTRFQQADLVAATGLTIGAAVDEAAMKQAADRLASSGMFTDVTYQYVQAPDGTKLQFGVADVGELLPVYFDNFVWLPHDTLIAELEKREPLFTGKVPNEGEMVQHLAAEIQQILKERNIAGEVKQMPLSTQDGKLLGFQYTVQGVKLPIERVDLTGVSPEMEPVIRKAIAAYLLHKDFSDSQVATITELDLLSEYRMRGYLKASLQNGGGELSDPATGAVAVKIAAVEGAEYKLAGIHWEGNAGVETGELAHAVSAKVGAPANAISIENDIAKAQKLFGAKGYMEARLVPSTSFDDSAHTVTYTVRVEEGPQYRMGNFSTEGLGEGPAGQVRGMWQLKPGAVFDGSYSNRFFGELARRFNLSSLNVDIREVPHRDSKTIDVTIAFRPRT